MGNFQKIINQIIAFCVVVIFLTFARYLVLPHMKVGVPSLPPTEATDNSWQSAMGGAIQFTGWAILIFLILWIIYKILRMIPIFGPIAIKALSFIFTPCRRSGIFGLFDMIFGVIFSFLPLPDRLANIVRGLFDFSKNSIGFIINSTADLAPSIDISFNPSMPKRKDDESSKKITSSDDEYILNQYNMCLNENLIPITSEMSENDKSYAISKNQTSRTLCMTKRFQAITDTILMKI